MTLPLVSCLMATAGRHTLVERAVSMFLAQDYPAKELHILNNHRQPLRLGFDAPNVIIHNEPGYPTLGTCRNRLLELARGEYVRTWDDDDLYFPWTLSQGVAHIGSSEAWKPDRSWWTNGGRGWTLAGNAMEASILVRADVAREARYRESGGDEHAPLLERIAGTLRTREVGPWASYSYQWGVGQHHISGTLGHPTMTVERRTSEWMAAQRDTPDRPLMPCDLKPLWQEILPFMEPIRAEARELFEGTSLIQRAVLGGGEGAYPADRQIAMINQGDDLLNLAALRNAWPELTAQTAIVLAGWGHLLTQRVLEPSHFRTGLFAELDGALLQVWQKRREPVWMRWQSY